MVAVLITITRGCIACSAPIRRVTWTHHWAVAAARNIALPGLALVLMSPLASETVGQVLQHRTVRRNPKDQPGHDAYNVDGNRWIFERQR